jgi:hypothetical protein
MKAFIASLMMVAFIAVPQVQASYSLIQPAYAEEVVEAEAAPAAVEAPAEEASEAEVVMPPTAGEWAKLVESLGGLKGAGTLAIVAFLVQLIMLLLRTQLGEFAGRWRLLAVLGLTMVGGVLGLKMQGMEWVAALMHSTTLAAAQVFGHQAFKQFAKKKA